LEKVILLRLGVFVGDLRVLAIDYMQTKGKGGDDSKYFEGVIRKGLKIK